MIILPLAVVVGAVLGLALRTPRSRWVLALSAPVLSVLALAAQFVPGGVQSCSASSGGPEVCQALPAVTAWGGPLPYLIAAALVLLSVAPAVSLRTGSWLPAGVSAMLQAVPQVISFGGFIAWAPALAATVATAFAVFGNPRRDVATPGAPR